MSQQNRMLLLYLDFGSAEVVIDHSDRVALRVPGLLRRPKFKHFPQSAGNLPVK